LSTNGLAKHNMLQRLLLIVECILFAACLHAQRVYTNTSVLASGNWYKVAVNRQGIYKVDVAFLNRLGVNTNGLQSQSIQLFGNGGGMLPENNALPAADDLVENAVKIMDGGDGVFSGSDYFLFYAPGPDRWLYDSAGSRYRYQKNSYSDQCFYYLNVRGAGKRMAIESGADIASEQVTTYDFLYHSETDTINFLKSGREWFGQEFSNTPGNATRQNFVVKIPGLLSGQSITIRTNVAARSVGAASGMEVRVNGQALPTLPIPMVSGNFLEAFATNPQQQATINLLAADSLLGLQLSFLPGAFNAQAWLNWLQVNTRAALVMQPGLPLFFRDRPSAGAGKIARFTVQNTPAATQVWNVTNPLAPVETNSTVSNGSLVFLSEVFTVKEFVAFDEKALLTPLPMGAVPNQNLHTSIVADMLLVTHPLLLAEAQRLSSFKTNNNGLRVKVVTTEQVFNEFSSGSPDPSAIRNFVKMYYDRAGGDSTKRPRFLLLLGDASFDYKQRLRNNTNLVPGYQSMASVNPLQTYTSDDFFGFLNDIDDINSTTNPPLLNIAIGRIPAATPAQAKTVVNKIIQYNNPNALGPWRMQSTFIADDEDGNLHFTDAEDISANAALANGLLVQNKIYLDAYKQEGGSGGSRYPAVNQAIINQLNSGSIVWNYSGHGGSQRLADEAIFDRDAVNKLDNSNRLPLFVTATCDFAPYDDPTVASIGDDVLMGNANGAIALTTTTRLVFAFSNKVINNNFLKVLLAPAANGQYLSIGEALRRAKNETYLQGDVVNNRKFTLLGDPSVVPAFATPNIQVTTINNLPPSGNDTLKALNKYLVAGQVTTLGGTVNLTFNGSVYVNIYGPQQQVTLLANDAGSTAATFLQQPAPFYKGRATVQNGQFSITFIVPKDVNFLPQTGQMVLYADNGQTDACQNFTAFKVGGTGSNQLADREGPVIQPFLNDEKFVNGGLVNQAPLLLLKLTDSSGINTAGTGIGHDITAVIDGNEKNILVLNDFYETELNSFQKGTVRFPLTTLTDGAHSIKVKAWDVANNPAEATIDFVVAAEKDLQLSHVFNYPNPFTTRTNFWFQHNQPPGNLTVLIQIFGVTGKLVHQIQRIINATGNRCNEIEWDGKDAYSEKLGKGVYIYKVTVTNSNGKKVTKTEKLYLL